MEDCIWSLPEDSEIWENESITVQLPINDSTGKKKNIEKKKPVHYVQQQTLLFWVSIQESFSAMSFVFSEVLVVIWNLKGAISIWAFSMSSVSLFRSSSSLATSSFSFSVSWSLVFSYNDNKYPMSSVT